MARKPLSGTVAQTVLAHGTGALNVDGCRIGTTKDVPASVSGGDRADGWGWRSGESGDEGGHDPNLGRWPANVLLDEQAAAQLDEQTGTLASATSRTSTVSSGLFHGGDAGVVYGDSGGASRFFKVVQWTKEDMCPRHDPANGAASCSCPPSAHDGSAPSDAATKDSTEASSPTGSQTLPSAPSTSGTPSESETRRASDTPTIPKPDDGHLHGRPLAERTPTRSHASGADILEPTGTTTTTTGRSTFAGSAESAMLPSTQPNGGHGGLGSPSGERFRYVAKASGAERNAGLDGFEAVHRVNGNKWTDQDYRVSRGERPPSAESGPRRNVHPTVKPIDVMRWLVRLVTPPDGLILDPFTGSGTTGCAAMLEGFRFIGIEREPEYADIAEARIRWWARRPGADTAKALEAVRAEDATVDAGQMGLFGP
jgi:hypothetical protein